MLSRMLRDLGLRTSGREVQLLSEEDRKLVAERYLDGESTRSLARQFDISRETIRKYLSDQGVPMRPSIRKSALTLEMKQEAAEAYEAGMTLQQIAEVFGVSYTTIRRALKELGVRSRPPGHRPRKNSNSDAPIGLLAAASLAAIAIGIWGWATRIR
jgi:transposase